MPFGTLSMKTSFTPAAAAALYSLAVAVGSLGIDTMMSGFCASTVSMSLTCLSGLKPASVTAITSIPISTNLALRPWICACDQSLPA